MAHEEREKRGGGYAAVFSVAAVLAMLTMLYILSLGPASWFVRTDRLSADTWEMFYGPVLWVANRSDSLRRVVVWYIDLFRPA